MKKNSTYIFLCITGFLLVLGCEGPAGPSGVQGTPGTNGKDGGFDKQIRLDFNITDTLQSQDTLGIVTSPQFRIVKFNKSNYLNVDSIVFLAFLRTSDTNTTSRLVLFNVTDTLNIDTLRTNKIAFTLMESKNIFNRLPDNKEIILAVKISSTKQDTLVEAIQPAVYLYRR